MRQSLRNFFESLVTAVSSRDTNLLTEIEENLPNDVDTEDLFLLSELVTTIFYLIIEAGYER